MERELTVNKIKELAARAPYTSGISPMEIGSNS